MNISEDIPLIISTSSADNGPCSFSSTFTLVQDGTYLPVDLFQIDSQAQTLTVLPFSYHDLTIFDYNILYTMTSNNSDQLPKTVSFVVKLSYTADAPLSEEETQPLEVLITEEETATFIPCQPQLNFPVILEEITVNQGDPDKTITLKGASNNNCRFVVDLLDVETQEAVDKNLFQVVQPFFNQTNPDDPLVQVDVQASLEIKSSLMKQKVGSYALILEIIDLVDSNERLTIPLTVHVQE